MIKSKPKEMIPMKNSFKKAVSVFLTAILLFTFAFSGTAAVVKDTSKELKTYSVGDKLLWNTLDVIVDGLLKGIAAMVPPLSKWTDSYGAKGFMEGTADFISQKSENAKWLLGYDSRSILLPHDEILGKMYVAGTIGVKEKFATEIVDDLSVRTVALSDNSGRGTAVFACIDSYGLSLSDVRELRTSLEAYAKENNINSITLSVLHQHSAVDTFGMNGNIWEMVFTNPAKNIFGMNTVNGKDEKYMDNLFRKCTESIKAATEGMTEGRLFEGEADAGKYIYDKRQPYVMDESFTRLRFVPENGGKETWIVTTAIHCVGNGAAGTAVTGDYPYYMEQEIKDTANLMVVLGAELGTTQNNTSKTNPEYDSAKTDFELIAGYGRAIARDILAISEETEIEPIFNIRYKEMYVPVENPILLFAAKCGAFDNIVRRNGLKYNLLTEIGYMELGENLAFAIVPGELAPELAYGGTLSGDVAWSGKDWEYPSMEEIVKTNRGENKKLLVLGLANDQIGYIVPDNDYMPMIHEDSKSLEFVSLGKNTASKLVTEFGALVAGLN